MPTPRPCLCPPVPAECDIWWGLGSGPGWARVLPTLLGGGRGERSMGQGPLCRALCPQKHPTLTHNPLLCTLPGGAGGGELGRPLQDPPAPPAKAPRGTVPAPPKAPPCPSGCPEELGWRVGVSTLRSSGLRLLAREVGGAGASP